MAEVAASSGEAGEMWTLGVDLSVQARDTALATIRWAEGAACVESLSLGVDDEELAEAIAAAEFCGVDSPLGWPRPMAAAVAAHSRGEPWPEPTKDEFRHRRTDRDVIELTRAATGTALHPLSVATDLIALPAWRLAGIRERVAAATGRRFDLTGGDGVFEVYPAAGLVLWGLPRKGYKAKSRAGVEVRKTILEEIGRRAPWLEWSPGTRERCLEVDHPLDAVLAALLTRAAAVGRSRRPAAADLEAARAEGWIHLPEVGLEDLAGELRQDAG